MMHTESKNVTIAVGNIITGVYNYLVISIPIDWRIVVIPMNSDVFTSTRQGNVKWVKEGEVEHGLATPKGEIMLRIKIWPGFKEHWGIKDLRRVEKIYDLVISGHGAKAYIYRKRHGLRTTRTLGIHLYCGITDRTILIEFIGGEDWVDAVLNSIGGSMCHV
ncbi:conserved hypothetical protein [Desulfurococcaceae archaeon AG1]|nr:conserved hypothetical protein [Desulfurococcaceae archaeon AG1]